MKKSIFNSFLLAMSLFTLISCGDSVNNAETNTNINQTNVNEASKNDETNTNKTNENEASKTEEIKKEKGIRKVYFGRYPQTKVRDYSILAELNTLAGQTPTENNFYKWKDYNYIINNSNRSYMFYQDIDYDGDGSYDYRGVYFTKYRPSLCVNDSSITSSYQKQNGYLINETYWFRYDPIEWVVLKEEDGKSLINSNLLLDSQEYYESYGETLNEHNVGKGYVNNYELSNIRKFLNDSFYNVAFNDIEKAKIETTLVDNSAASIGQDESKYACNDTEDKMFLLSFMEVKEYYPSRALKRNVGTNYAKCQGLFVDENDGFGEWWTRSAGFNYPNYVYLFTHDARYVFAFPNSTSRGVLPACWVKF